MQWNADNITIDNIISEYERLIPLEGKIYAHVYIHELCRIWIEDSEQPKLVREGVQRILEMFKEYENKKEKGTVYGTLFNS